MRTGLSRPTTADAGVALRLARAARRLALLATVAPVMIAAACGDDDSPTEPGSGPITGSYSMATVRGFSVPHTFTDAAGSKLTIEGGSLSLDGGTFALNRKGRLNNLTFDLTEEGTYTMAAGTVTFTPDDGDPSYTGKVQGSVVTVDDYKIAGVKFDLAFKAK